jgi:(S)-citramalyl-CoA lyase
MLTRLKSWLFTPATRPERFANAAVVSADTLIMDLEDAVAPADKASARATALRHLDSAPGEPARVLRINGIGTRHGLSDLTALLDAGRFPDAVLLPKVESPWDLEFVDRLLTQAGASTQLVALIESARGVDAVNESLAASKRVVAAMLGAADLAADYGCAGVAPNLVWARARLVSAAAQARIDAIDSPWFDLKDDTGFAADITQAVAMGFAGKAAIHPRQIPAINHAFTPSDADVAHARAVLAVNRAGVGQVDGAMVDEAVARKARRILAQANLPTTD